MSETEELENIGGFPYILDYLSVYLPYTVISGTSAILGLVGNAILISSVLISKKLRTNPTCILITNIAMADLFISLIVHPSTVAGVLLGKTFFDKHMALCESLGSLCLISCVVSLITMGFLALNRYVCIFYLFRYKKLFSIGNTIKMCFLTWTIGFLIDLPNFFGIGAHVYDLKTLTCHFDRLKAHFTVPLVIFCIFLPGIIIGSLHMRIYISTSTHSDLRRKQFASQYHYTLSAVRVARSLFITFIVFFICWIPFSIVLISDTKDKMPIWLHTFANSAAHFHSSLNPIIYLLTNPLIRGGYRNLIRVLTCHRLFADDEIDENYSRTNRLTNRTVMYHSSANAADTADAQQLEIE